MEKVVDQVLLIVIVIENIAFYNHFSSVLLTIMLDIMIVGEEKVSLSAFIEAF